MIKYPIITMSINNVSDVTGFLKPFNQETEDMFLWLREFVWNKYPMANELVYDNYNAFVVGWSPTDRVGHTFCSVAIGRTSNNVHFGFYWGNELHDPNKMLLGQGKQYRYILVKNRETFPEVYITALIHEAWLNSLAKIKDNSQQIESLTIIKSISPAKRERKKIA